MKVYGCPTTRSVRVVWTLEEIGTDYEYTRIDLSKGEGREAGFLAVNPGGKVPVLVDGGTVLTESLAICTWLGERFPAAGLVPAPGSAERADYLRWAVFAVAELEQPLWTVSKHKFVLPEERRVPAVIDTARWEYETAIGLLDARLDGREYLAGDRFSVADILAAHTLAWGRKAAPGAETPRVTGYAERMLERAALARARDREAA